MTFQDEHKANGLMGKLLLSMPQMGDPRFHRAVILMCAHDKDGAMGLVINHMLPGIDLAQLIEQLNIDSDKDVMTKAKGFPVMSGGPVETARGFVLHSDDFKQDDTIKISDKIGVTGTIDALKAIAQGGGPDHMRFILGYAGWSAGQLDSEIKQNSWLVSEADPELIFSEDDDAMWEKAVSGLGFDPAMLSDTAGRA